MYKLFSNLIFTPFLIFKPNNTKRLEYESSFEKFLNKKKNKYPLSYQGNLTRDILSFIILLDL